MILQAGEKEKARLSARGKQPDQGREKGEMVMACMALVYLSLDDFVALPDFVAYNYELRLYDVEA